MERQLDKFYTKPEVARHCIDVFRHVVAFDPNDSIIEPSAGAGAFYDPIIEFWRTTYFIDIAPEFPTDMCDAVNQMDFLTEFITPDRENTQKMHVIGNPPFGRQSTLARQFIRKAQSFQKAGDAIGFILPISFRKPSFARIFANEYVQLHDEILSARSFTLNGEDYDVRCVFQIWIKSSLSKTREFTMSSRRASLMAIGGANWRYTKKNDALQASARSFAIRRVGINAGRATIDVINCNPQCFYFVELQKEILWSNLTLIVNQMCARTYAHNTVGPRSLDKIEVAEQLNLVIRDIS